MINLRSKKFALLTQSYSAVCKTLCFTNLILGPSHPLLKPTFLPQCPIGLGWFELSKFIRIASSRLSYETNLLA